MSDGTGGELLSWTGHPLVDVGIAGLTAFAGRRDPTEVTADEIDEFRRFAEQQYLTGDLMKSIGVLFTMNSFLHPTKSAEQRQAIIRDAIDSYRAPHHPGLPSCIFCGRDSIAVLHREHVPMILGQSVVNFYPGGKPGLSVCGNCRLALHGLSVAAPRCSGKALVVFTDDREFQVELVREWVQRARKIAELGSVGEAGALRAPRTRVVEALVRVERAGMRQNQPIGVVAYHISNSGQGPGIDVLPLPSTVVSFVRRASAGRYRDTWQAIQRRAWQRIDRKGTSAADIDDERRGEYRNYLYEDLFSLPESTGRFIRLYFLRNAAGLVQRSVDDPRSDYDTGAEIDLVQWALVELFVVEVLGMDQARVSAIRTLGDRLADEVVVANDRRLLRLAYMARDYRTVRRILLQVDRRTLERSAAPVIGLDDFLLVFEEGEELARTDWRLAWDLVLIRMIEQLYKAGKAGMVTDAVGEEDIDLAEEAEAAV